MSYYNFWYCALTYLGFGNIEAVTFLLMSVDILKQYTVQVHFNSTDTLHWLRILLI